MYWSCWEVVWLFSSLFGISYCVQHVKNAGTLQQVWWPRCNSCVESSQVAQSADITHPHKSSASIMTKYYKQLTNRRNFRICGLWHKGHQKVQGFLKSEQPVALSNCEVKESEYTTKLEVVVHKNSDPQKKLPKFDANLTNLVCDRQRNNIYWAAATVYLPEVSVGAKVLTVRDPGGEEKSCKAGVCNCWCRWWVQGYTLGG